MNVRSFVGAVAMVGLSWTFAGVARADDADEQDKLPKTPRDLPMRASSVGNSEKFVTFSVSYRDVVDAETRKKLISGLPTVITLRAYLFRPDETEPMALAAKSCHVVYDLWEEVFRIQVTARGEPKAAVAINVEGVLRRCAEADGMALVERALVSPDQTYFVAAIAEVNPVSKATLERIKGWVARPNGSAAIGPGDSLFGSFVGLFVARINDADRRVSFRTELFLPPNEPPPSDGDDESFLFLRPMMAALDAPSKTALSAQEKDRARRGL